MTFFSGPEQKAHSNGVPSKFSLVFFIYNLGFGPRNDISSDICLPFRIRMRFLIDLLVESERNLFTYDSGAIRSATSPTIFDRQIGRVDGSNHAVPSYFTKKPSGFIVI